MDESNSLPPRCAEKRSAGKIASWIAGLLRVRWLMRAPIGVYRARLGGLFGRRLLMLEHTGRKSGLVRYVVLEVVSRPAPGSYIVASGLGSGAQWFRNVQADSHVRLFITSRRPASATAHVLTPAETRTAMTAYRAAHPKAWSALKSVLQATLGTAIDDSGADLPMVRFDLDAESI